MSASSDSVSKHTSRSLVYGLGLLKLFSAQQPVRGIAELADLMGVSRPTAHRYATTCLELGYLEQAPMRRYQLARKSALVGEAMLGSLLLVQRAAPILRTLREQTARTVSLAVLDGQDVVYLQRLCGFERGQYALEGGLGAGSRRLARQTAAGKALLRTQSEQMGRETQWLEHRGLALEVDAHEGRPRTRVGGLAIAVEAEGGFASAIEITVPAEAMSAAELLASLSEPLRGAGAKLRGVLERYPAREGQVELVH